MGGNPTAGILLMLLGAALLAMGMSGKGKQILALIMGQTPEVDTSQLPTGPAQSGGYVNPSDAPSVAGFAGEKPAKAVMMPL